MSNRGASWITSNGWRTRGLRETSWQNMQDRTERFWIDVECQVEVGAAPCRRESA